MTLCGQAQASYFAFDLVQAIAASQACLLGLGLDITHLLSLRTE